MKEAEEQQQKEREDKEKEREDKQKERDEERKKKGLPPIMPGHQIFSIASKSWSNTVIGF
jgi:hypothetical protein